MMIEPFTLLQVPKVDFGIGTFSNLSRYMEDYRSRGDILFVMGNTVAHNTSVKDMIQELEGSGTQVHQVLVHGEPTVESIDEIAKHQYDSRISLVIGIGGGSVLDSAKAVSVMIFHQHKWKDPSLSIMNYLEGVGTKKAPPYRLPLILIPTTSGTGSEATKNGVISKVGIGGFKKSFRHDTYIPDIAIIDPIFTVTLNKEITASSGLDALTQLMEGYVSTINNTYVDSIALFAIHSAGEALDTLLRGDLGNVDARSAMSYAAYISGITLAHKGLHYVHGLSGPMGAIRPIPHGVACAVLIAPIHRALLEEAQKDLSIPSHADYIAKMTRIAQGWGKETPLQGVEYIESIVERGEFKPLRDYGFTVEDLVYLSKLSSKRNSPVTLSETTIYSLLISLL